MANSYRLALLSVALVTVFCVGTVWHFCKCPSYQQTDLDLTGWTGERAPVRSLDSEHHQTEYSIMSETQFENKNNRLMSYNLLLAMVVSAPKNRARRDTIRRTWKNSYFEQGKQFLVKFVVGTLQLNDEDKKLVIAESNETHDMVLLTDHFDSYNNLTRKVLRMFMWAEQNVNYSYLLKIDDDCFARLDTIESELKARTFSKALYWGYIATHEIPKRAGQWKEENWDLCNHYLPYAFGGGYVLSADLVHRLAINANGLILYNNEDVAVGTWVSPFALERKHDQRFGVTPIVYTKCRNDYLVMHYQSIENMEKRHTLMTSSRTLC